MKVKANKNRSYREKQRKAAAINAQKYAEPTPAQNVYDVSASNPNAKEFEIVDYDFNAIRPIDYSKPLRKEYKIVLKGDMPLVFANPCTNFMATLSTTILTDNQTQKNSRFVIIPTESNIKVRCGHVEGKVLSRIYFLRVPVSEMKAFETEMGMVTPSEDIIFYAGPLSRDKATGEMKYIIAPMDNILAAKTSRCEEGDLYRIVTHYENELYDSYAPQN